ncbi:MAG TPA: hypothetical protein PK536_10780 [Ignavibacteria bacterium]|nr:hypothetical protein [Ignavibacteria bacterium]HRJ98332.1 hypothetical protein [Ignavibacteria bacterium]
MIRTIVIVLIIFIFLSLVRTFYRMLRPKAGNVIPDRDKPGRKKDGGNIIDAKYEEIN